MTRFRFVFRFQDTSQAERYLVNLDDLVIPLFTIKMIKNWTKLKMKNIQLNQLKNTREYKFYIWNKESFQFFVDLIESVYPYEPEKLVRFTYDYFTYAKNLKDYSDWWNMYDIKSEFERQGITERNSYKLRYSEINSDYQLCRSYLNLLVVPEAATDQEMIRNANFRNKSRFPVVTYLYTKDGNSICIWRSSQIKSGVTSPGTEDGNKIVMDKIIGMNGKLLIIDSKPNSNNMGMGAIAKTIYGGSSGNENPEQYRNSELEYCDIDDFRETRNSYDKVVKISKSGRIIINQRLFSDLDESRWYEFIYKILKNSLIIVNTIIKNKPVLVHCSNRWDRSAQLASTAQIILEPNYRTLKGFAVLIEKGWLSFGHQFGLRQGINLTKENSDEFKSV